jgi:hypothetical protein
MKRFIPALTLAAAAAALSTPAQAAGLGFTAQTDTNYETRGFYTTTGAGIFNLPSVDIRTKGWIIQVDALETLASITRKEVNKDGDETNGLHLGVAGYTTNIKKDVKDGIEGVVQPGAKLLLDTNTSFGPAYWSLLGSVRMGAQASKKMGFGMYVVPHLGIAGTPDLRPDGDPTENTIGLAVGGQLQISAWLNGAM